MVARATGTTQHFAIERRLQVGDYVEVTLWNDFDATIEADVTFNLRRIGLVAPQPKEP